MGWSLAFQVRDPTLIPRNVGAGLEYQQYDAKAKEKGEETLLSFLLKLGKRGKRTKQKQPKLLELSEVVKFC